MTEESLKSFKQILSRHRDDLIEIIESDCPHRDLNLHGAEIKDVLKVVNDVKNALESIEKKISENAQFVAKRLRLSDCTMILQLMFAWSIILKTN
jgi:hypothetical protein